MTVYWALATIAITAGVCAAVGIGARAALGYYCPNYYKAVLRQQPGMEFDPVQIGVGFGLNAGAFTGVVIGVLVVAIVAYFELRVRLEQIRQKALSDWDSENN